MTFLEHLRSLADANGRLTADLIVARTELSVERERVVELEGELRAIRARIATIDTEKAIAEAYGAPLEARQ